MAHEGRETSCGCGFVNATSDHYCGGCGVDVLPSRPDRDTGEPTTIPIDVIEEVAS